MSSTTDDDERDESEFDPRWEVQPELDDGDGTNGSRHRLLLALLAAAAGVSALMWALSNAPTSP